AVPDAAHADAALLGTGASVTNGPGLGIGDVDHVIAVDIDTAWTAELWPFLDERAIPVEDLDAIVAAIANEQAPLRIEGERVRLVELAGARSFLSELAQVLAGSVEHDDARIVSAVPLADEDVAVGVGDDIVGLIESLRAGAATGNTQGHQQLPV